MLMCGVGAKPVAHLMKWAYLLQWEVAKVKFLMNSNMTLTVHQKTDPKVQQDFKGEGKQWQGQRSNQGHTMTLHTYHPPEMSPPSIAPYSFEDTAWTRL